jgi:Domain of unknown function (DUF1843)
MAKPPLQALTLQKLRDLLDPGRVFYRVAVDDALKRGDLHEIQALIKGAKEVQAKHGDLNSLISKLEGAARKAQG